LVLMGDRGIRKSQSHLRQSFMYANKI
jgi:hypothetical protein